MAPTASKPATFNLRPMTILPSARSMNGGAGLSAFDPV
jgi:hypothetical protein